jgi:hypothetical protein
MKMDMMTEWILIGIDFVILFGGLWCVGRDLPYPEDLPPDMIAFYQPPEAGQAIAMVVWVGVWFAANYGIACMMG